MLKGVLSSINGGRKYTINDPFRRSPVRTRGCLAVSGYYGSTAIYLKMTTPLVLNQLVKRHFYENLHKKKMRWIRIIYAGRSYDSYMCELLWTYELVLFVYLTQRENKLARHGRSWAINSPKQIFIIKPLGFGQILITMRGEKLRKEII